jgi:hypothetical protein
MGQKKGAMPFFCLIGAFIFFEQFLARYLAIRKAGLVFCMHLVLYSPGFGLSGFIYRKGA